MKLFGTLALGFAATLLALSPATVLAQPATPMSIDNGVFQTQMFSNSNLGGDCGGSHVGFTYMGVGGLGTVFCAASFLIGIDNTLTVGQNYTALDNTLGWIPGSIAASTTFPYAGLDQGVEATFSDNHSLGLDVVANAYFSANAPNDDFLVLEYEITNNSGGDLTGLVPGLFMDWDLDPFATNEGAIDTALDAFSVFDGTNTTMPDFATLVLNDDLVGWTCFIGYPTAGQHDTAALFSALTTPSTTTCAPQDIRGPIGTTPVDLANGASHTVTFAMVAGTDATDLMNNITSAQSVTTAISAGPDGVPGTHSLSAVYPNPFNPQARFTLEVAEQQNVRIAVYDALGREVASLFSGTLAAGPAHEFTIDGASLPSGAYMVRAFGEHFSATQSVTLMK